MKDQSILVDGIRYCPCKNTSTQPLVVQNKPVVGTPVQDPEGYTDSYIDLRVGSRNLLFERSYFTIDGRLLGYGNVTPERIRVSPGEHRITYTSHPSLENFASTITIGQREVVGIEAFNPDGLRVVSRRSVDAPIVSAPANGLSDFLPTATVRVDPAQMQQFVDEVSSLRTTIQVASVVSLIGAVWYFGFKEK